MASNVTDNTLVDCTLVDCTLVESTNIVDCTLVDCPICFESFDSTQIVTICANHHSACKKCYADWRKKCLDTHREITCPCCRNMSLSCLVCWKDFPHAELEKPCIVSDHYYCKKCLTHGIHRFNLMKCNTLCILCHHIIHKYKPVFGPELPPEMLNKRYDEKSILIDEMLDKFSQMIIHMSEFNYQINENQ